MGTGEAEDKACSHGKGLPFTSSFTGEADTGEQVPSRAGLSSLDPSSLVLASKM